MTGHGKPDSDLVEAVVITSPAALLVVQSIVEESGIPFFVKNEGTQNLVAAGQLGFGYNSAVGAPVIVVERHRVAEVQALLKPLYESGEAYPAPFQAEPEREPEVDRPERMGTVMALLAGGIGIAWAVSADAPVGIVWVVAATIGLIALVRRKRDEG